MTNYKTTSQTVLLKTKTSYTSASDVTYTPVTALNLDTVYRKIIIVIDNKNSAAPLDMVINGDTSASYDTNWIQNVLGTVTGGSAANQGLATLQEGMTAADSIITIEIVYHETQDVLKWTAISATQQDHISIAGGELDTTTVKTITSLKFYPASGTMDGSYAVYGLKY